MRVSGIDYQGNNTHMRDQLEALLDRYGSPEMLVEALAVIASEKADHVQSNWQDEDTARLWEKIARSLDRETARLAKYGNPYS